MSLSSRDDFGVMYAMPAASTAPKCAAKPVQNEQNECMRGGRYVVFCAT